LLHDTPSSDLSGKPDLGAGVEATEVLEQTPTLVRVKARAAADAKPGQREVAVGWLKILHRLMLTYGLFGIIERPPG